MLLTALCFCALSQQQTPAPKEGPPGRTLLAIYQEHTVFVNGMGGGVGHTSGQSLRYDRLGDCNWEVLDGGYHGTPCKIFTGGGSWKYVKSIKNTAIKEYHETTLSMQYYVGLDGIPLHSESHFDDQWDDKDNFVDVVADYRSDHIDETVTRNGVAETNALYPTFGMDRFAGMFEPMMRSGLIEHSDMDCVVLHPYTGVPYEFKLQVASRFTGYYFFLPQAGYCINIDSSEGRGTAYLSRQGQLLEETLPNRVDASMEDGPLAEERNGWGSFQISDWDKATDETNPERPTYHTLVIPVMFKNPDILFPVPCALTD